jgi:hypothetical protein
MKTKTATTTKAKALAKATRDRDCDDDKDEDPDHAKDEDESGDDDCDRNDGRNGLQGENGTRRTVMTTTRAQGSPDFISLLYFTPVALEYTK